MRSGDGATVEADKVIRVGLRSVQSLRAAGIASILAARAEKPFTSVADFVRRTAMSAKDRHTLSSAGALNLLSGSRRQALWESAKVDLEFDLFAQVQSADDSARLLTPMSILERINADFAAVGLTSGEHPMHYLRAQFPNLWRADELPLAKNGTLVQVGGSVICRQRPGTAKGFVFISLEDESGVANVIVRPDLFEASRLVITQNPALVIDGAVQAQDGVIHVKAERISALRTEDLPVQASHDFH
jgi:error-prone DNA polymerase